MQNPNANSPTKAQLRAERLAARRALPPSEAVTRSAAILERLRALGEFRDAPFLMTYVASKDNEVDTRALIEELLAQNRSVAAPIARSNRTMDWRLLNASRDLVTGSFGILEPAPESCSAPTPCKRSVVLVPGIAFTREGYRIGYGGGYFDRYLATFPGISIGLAYDLQIVADMPLEGHDVPLDIVVTEFRVYRRTVSSG